VAIRAPLGWLGPGRLVPDVVVVIAGGRVAFAGSARDLAAARAGGLDIAVGAAREPVPPEPPEPDEEFVVDGFLMPGVADRHVHTGFSPPGAILAGGVTAVRDLGWPPHDVLPLALASESATFDGPLIRAVGPIITARGGYPARAPWAPPGTGVEVQGADEAAEVARRVAGAGSAGAVKVALNADAGPVLRDDELVAICGAAHAAGAVVTVHAQGVGQAERAVGAGVDEFAHCPWSERLHEDLIAAMARRMRVVSTLDIHSFGRDTPELRTAVDNLRRFAAAGGRVAYGTDLGNGAIPAGIHAGEAAHLADAGLDAEAVLETMMYRPLVPGEPGDVVAFRGNPLDDIAELGEVVFVMRSGRRVR
jgi:imidazolonepropionase-like amidohydrolase